MQFYRKRAAEFERIANAAQSPNVRSRYHLVARRYKELADFEAQSDKAKVAERLKAMRLESAAGSL